MSGQINNQSTTNTVSYALDIVELKKQFVRRSVRGGYSTIKSGLLSLFRRQGAPAAQLTVAIRNLTLRIPLGSSVGVIGRNGSGKSTLLKLITGIYKPTSGRVSVCGRVAALIELGAGFHPDFSGRENLILGGIMHGLSRKQIAERFDDMVRFAELESVIDEPVRTYSSGMFMRLGFSLAVHSDPELLLIDEVLAVGDAGFVAKCKDRISELRRRGVTMLLVSHDLESVERWCDEVVWLHKGEVKDRGEPRRVIDHYREFLERGEEMQRIAARDEQAAQSRESSPSADASEDSVAPERWGSREIELTRISLRSRSGAEHLVFHPNDMVELEVEYLVHDSYHELDGARPVFGIAIQRADGVMIFGSNTHIERVEVPDLGRAGIVRVRIDRLGLLEGAYSVDVAVHREDGYPFDYRQRFASFAVRSGVAQVGIVEPPHSWVIEPLAEPQVGQKEVRHGR